MLTLTYVLLLLVLSKTSSSNGTEPNANFSEGTTDAYEILSTVASLREDENEQKGAINPHRYPIIFEPANPCKQRSPFLITFVHTAPWHYRQRELIRETWGSKQINEFLDNIVIFVLGTTDNETVTEMMALEQDKYGDFLQADFHDSYRNLTVKHTAWYKWVRRECPNTKYVMKTDDDVFVNPFTVKNHLINLHQRGIVEGKTIMCNVYYKARPQRVNGSKWFVSKRQYRPKYYPPHCPGLAYIITSDLVTPIYKRSLSTRFFWIDDVYITGILAKGIGVTHHNMASAFVLDPKLVDRANEVGTIMFGLTDGIDQTRKLWDRMCVHYKEKFKWLTN